MNKQETIDKYIALHTEVKELFNSNIEPLVERYLHKVCQIRRNIFYIRFEQLIRDNKILFSYETGCDYNEEVAIPRSLFLRDANVDSIIAEIIADNKRAQEQRKLQAEEKRRQEQQQKDLEEFERLKKKFQSNQ